MMKKILTLAVTLLFVCSLCVGCGQKSAYATIESAVKKTQTLESVAVKMDMDMTVSSEGMSISMPITLDMKAKDIKSENPIILTDLGISVLGQTLNAQVYQENGWSYTVIGDSKYKTYSEPQMDQYDYSDEMVQIIPEELLQGVKMEKGADGAATATITIPGEKFTEIYADLLDSLSSNMSVAEDLTAKDAVVTISVADGYISAYHMTFCLEATEGDEVASMDVEASITYENPGKPVEITPPEGYMDFEEK